MGHRIIGSLDPALDTSLDPVVRDTVSFFIQYGI